MYDSLRSSAVSRFGFMHWVGFIISFPRKQQGDFTLDKYERSLTNPNIYGDRATTWEVNPRWESFEVEGGSEEHEVLAAAHYKPIAMPNGMIKMQHPLYQPTSDEWVIIEDLNIEVPKEFQEDFENDGVDAMTRLMAQPPLTEGGFFENPHTITEAVDHTLQPIVSEIGERIVVLQDTEAGEHVTRRYVTRNLLLLPPKVEGSQYYMHGDPGLKVDSFTIAVAHTMPETKTVSEASGKVLELQRVVVDFVLSWDPRSQRVVDFLNVDDVIKKSSSSTA